MKVMKVYTKLAKTYRLGDQFQKKIGGPPVMHKGKPLTVRTADVHFLGQLDLPEDCKITQDFFADIAAARGGNEIAQARVKSFLNQIDFSNDRIITLDEGEYERLGGGYKDNPRHKVYLERDYRVLPLNIGHLELFSGNKQVDELLRRAGGFGDKSQMTWFEKIQASFGDNQLDSFKEMYRECLVVNSPSVYDSIDLPVIMNPALISERVRLRPLSEPLAEVFMSPYYREINKEFIKRHIITISRYDKGGVEAGALEIEIAREKIEESDRFVFRSVSDPSRRITKSPSDRNFANCIIFELVPLEDSLFVSPSSRKLTTTQV